MLGGSAGGAGCRAIASANWRETERDPGAALSREMATASRPHPQEVQIPRNSRLAEPPLHVETPANTAPARAHLGGPSLSTPHVPHREAYPSHGAARAATVAALHAHNSHLSDSALANKILQESHRLHVLEAWRRAATRGHLSGMREATTHPRTEFSGPRGPLPHTDLERPAAALLPLHLAQAGAVAERPAAMERRYRAEAARRGAALPHERRRAQEEMRRAAFVKEEEERRRAAERARREVAPHLPEHR